MTLIQMKEPLTAFYREERREGAIDSCTGEVFRGGKKGKWIQSEIKTND